MDATLKSYNFTTHLQSRVASNHVRLPTWLQCEPETPKTIVFDFHQYRKLPLPTTYIDHTQDHHSLIHPGQGLTLEAPEPECLYSG